jgi:hypothetical protein
MTSVQRLFFLFWCLSASFVLLHPLLLPLLLVLLLLRLLLLLRMLRRLPRPACSAMGQ